ncbi:MAG TPA: hypothetical protein VEI97_12205, partial [bacterium]|nr:hypothetical protein [bacterium]
WTDGDGDLGILPDNNNTTDYNYYITLYKQKGGTFKPVTTPFSFNGRFPNLNPEGETSTKPFKLRGDLSYKVNTFTVTPPGQIGTIDGIPETLKKGDVIRFDVKIKDRAGNMSNQITTEAVTL